MESPVSGASDDNDAGFFFACMVGDDISYQGFAETAGDGAFFDLVCNPSCFDESLYDGI